MEAAAGVDLDALDLQRVLHPNTNLMALHRGGPLVLVRGRGVHVFDNHGKQYIEAMAVRYSANPKADRAALAKAYSQAMGALSKRNPDDLDAATLYAESLMNLRPWKLWTLDGKPAPGTDEIVAILESVMRRSPNHIGANHYYIHSTEASRSPERALASAKRLETLVPAAGHLVHMPAHVYARTGDHAGAARANQAGAEADRVYLKTAPADSLYGITMEEPGCSKLVNVNLRAFDGGVRRAA